MGLSPRYFVSGGKVRMISAKNNTLLDDENSTDENKPARDVLTRHSLHLFNPSNFSPSAVSFACEQFFFSHSRGSPGKAKPCGGSISCHERMRIFRKSSRESSAGVIEMYCAIRT